MKKKVLVIATYFPPSGGIGVFRITKFVKYLKKSNYEVVVVTIDNKYCINYDESFMQDIDGVNVYRIDFQNKNNKVAKNFTRKLKKELPTIIKKEQPNILFLTGGPFEILPLGRFVYDKYNIPYIIDLRDPWSLQKISGADNLSRLKCRLIRKYQSLLENYSFKKAKYICVINDTMKQDYKKKYSKYNFEVITNGYDEDDFRDIIPYQFDKFTIVYSGKFEVSAGFRDPSKFFQALSKLDNVMFCHIGNKEEKIIKLAKENNCYDKCLFLGFKPYNEVVSYLKGASLLLLISGKEKSEQTGKIFDYMGCERPILALTNKNNEIYKICKDLKNVYIADNNATDEIVKAIKKATKIKENSKEYDNKYSREQLCKQLIELIEK